MKPVERLPVVVKGSLQAERYEEVQKFVACGCKYAEVESFSDKGPHAEENGYSQVVHRFDFGVDIKVHNIKGKIYLERLEKEV